MRAEASEPRREMSPFDAWLYRGDGNPRTRSVLVAACVLDGALDRDRFAEAFDRASRLIPRLRQRVVTPPVSMFLPSWIVDPDFELAQHLRVVAAPRPGTLREVLSLVQTDVTTRLEELRPLWQATLVEGLEGGNSAVIFKISHAIADGAGALRLFEALFRRQRNGGSEPMPPPPIPEDVTPEELLRAALKRAPRAATEAALRAGRGALEAAKDWISDPIGRTAAAWEYTTALRDFFAVQPAPAAALRGRGFSRRCAAFEIPLEQMKRTGRAANVSVNDVYVAGITGALRLYLDELGQPAETLPMALPVNLRSGEEEAAGNHFGVILLAAPLAIGDPRARLAAVRERVLAGRAGPLVGAVEAMAEVMARLPQDLLDAIANRLPPPDIQASNIAGSPAPTYLGGRRVRQMFAFGPVPGTAGMFTLQSLAGQCHIGLNFDPAAITRPDLLAQCLRAGFLEVLRVGGGRVSMREPVLGGSALNGAPR